MYHLHNKINKDNNINYQFAAIITISFLQQTSNNAFTLPVIICLFVSNANSFSLHFYSKKKETNSYCTVAGYNMLHCTVRSVVDTLDWFLRYSLSSILTICPSHPLSFIHSRHSFGIYYYWSIQLYLLYIGRFWIRFRFRFKFRFVDH